MEGSAEINRVLAEEVLEVDFFEGPAWCIRIKPVSVPEGSRISSRVGSVRTGEPKPIMSHA